jgi:hypothetical protein
LESTTTENRIRTRTRLLCTALLTEDPQQLCFIIWSNHCIDITQQAHHRLTINMKFITIKREVLLFFQKQRGTDHKAHIFVAPPWLVIVTFSCFASIWLLITKSNEQFKFRNTLLKINSLRPQNKFRRDISFLPSWSVNLSYHTGIWLWKKGNKYNC